MYTMISQLLARFGVGSADGPVLFPSEIARRRAGLRDLSGLIESVSLTDGQPGVRRYRYKAPSRSGDHALDEHVEKTVETLASINAASILQTLSSVHSRPKELAASFVDVPERGPVLGYKRIGDMRAPGRRLRHLDRHVEFLLSGVIYAVGEATIIADSPGSRDAQLLDLRREGAQLMVLDVRDTDVWVLSSDLTPSDLDRLRSVGQLLAALQAETEALAKVDRASSSKANSERERQARADLFGFHRKEF